MRRPGRNWRVVHSPPSLDYLRAAGARQLYYAESDDGLRAIVAYEPLQKASPIIGGDDGYRWHMSLSRAERYPTWDEQRDARYELLPDVAYVAQVLPPEGQYVNLHPNTFHWYEMRDGDSVSETP